MKFFFAFAALVYGHFTLLAPPSRGKDEILMLNGPCGGYDEVSGNRTKMPLISEIVIKSAHTSADLSFFVSFPPSPFVAVGTDSLSKLGLHKSIVNFKNISQALNGKKATLQVVFKYSREGNLYQCSDVTFDSNLENADGTINGSNLQSELSAVNPFLLIPFTVFSAVFGFLYAYNKSFFRSKWSLVAIPFKPFWSLSYVLLLSFVVVSSLFVFIFLFSPESDWNYNAYSYFGLFYLSVAPLFTIKPIVSICGMHHQKAAMVHILLSSAGIVFCFLHGALYVILWARDGALDLLFEQESKENLFGMIGIVVLILLALSSTPIVRNRMYVFFIVFHQIAYLLFCVFAALHTTKAILYLAPGFAVYFLSKMSAHLMGMKLKFTVEDLGDELSRVTLSGYTGPAPCPGQHFVLFGRGSWHPYSALQVDCTELTFYIRNGRFQRHLLDLQLGGRDSIVTSGPYGNSFSASSPNTVLIAAGIGINALVPFMKLTEFETIQLIWVCKSIDMVEIYMPFFQHLRTKVFITESAKEESSGGLIPSQKKLSNVDFVEFHSGRPDFVNELKLFNDISSQGKGVLVKCCGPHEMVTAVRRVAKKLSTRITPWTVEHEVF